jgi:hypothetical protein
VPSAEFLGASHAVTAVEERAAEQLVAPAAEYWAQVGEEVLPFLRRAHRLSHRPPHDAHTETSVVGSAEAGSCGPAFATAEQESDMSTNRDKVHDERQTRAKMCDPGVYLSGKNWLDHSEACARVDQMLLGGASLEQLESSGRKRSAVMSHLGHLKSEHGLAIGREGGIYRFAYGEGASSPGPSSPEAASEPSHGPRPEPTPPRSAVPPADLIPAEAVPSRDCAVRSAEGSGAIARLFAEAERIVRDEARRNPSGDLRRQVEIIVSRRFPRVTDGPGILNNLIIQGSSYSVVRRYFGALYAEDIWRFDREYGTHFFEVGRAPAFGYPRWEAIVLEWGNVLLREAGQAPVSELAAVVPALERAHPLDRTALGKKPRSRIVMTLATALPKIRDEMLPDPVGFLDRLDEVSRAHPGRAYDLAVAFGRDIAQMGPALVCNFFKELGLLHYVKVDVHIGNFMGELTLERKLSPKDEFILSWLLAREAGMEPFFLDKILYVGGKYCGPRLGALCRSLRADYEDEVNRLVGEIPGRR